MNLCKDCRFRVTTYAPFPCHLCDSPEVRATNFVTGETWRPTCYDVRRIPGEVREYVEHCPHFEEKT